MLEQCKTLHTPTAALVTAVCSHWPVYLQALTNLRKPQQTSEVVSWCTSLASTLSAKQKPQSSSPSVAPSSPSSTPASSQSASPTADAPHELERAADNALKSTSHLDSTEHKDVDGDGVRLGSSSKQSDGSGDGKANKLSLAQLQEPASQVSGFKPRVMFRLNISGTGAAVGSGGSELVCRRDPDPPLPSGHCQEEPEIDPAKQADEPPLSDLPPQPEDAPVAAAQPDSAGVALAPIEQVHGSTPCVDTGPDTLLSPAPLPPEPEAAERAADAGVQCSEAEGQGATAVPVEVAVVTAEASTVPAETDAVPAGSSVAALEDTVSRSAAEARVPVTAAPVRKSRWDMRADPPVQAEPPAPVPEIAASPPRHHERHRVGAPMPPASAAAGASRPASSASPAAPADAGEAERDYARSRSRDADRDRRRDRDADSARERDWDKGRDRERDRDKDGDRNLERDWDRGRDREREWERDRVRDLNRDRPPNGDTLHRGAGYSDLERKRGRFERDGSRRQRDKLPRLHDDRSRPHSQDREPRRTEGWSSAHSRGVRGFAADVGGSHTPCAAAAKPPPPVAVLRTPSACAPVRTSKAVGLIIEEEPVTPPSADGLFTVSVSRAVVPREESVTPVAAVAAERSVAARAESPATPPPSGKSVLGVKATVKPEVLPQPLPNGHTHAGESAVPLRSVDQPEVAAHVEPPPHLSVGTAEPAVLASTAAPAVKVEEDLRAHFPEVHGSPVTPPGSPPGAETQAAQRPFGAPLAPEDPQEPPASLPAARPLSDRPAQDSAPPRPPPAPPTPVVAPASAHATALDKPGPHDGAVLLPGAACVPYPLAAVSDCGVASSMVHRLDGSEIVRCHAVSTPAGSSAAGAAASALPLAHCTPPSPLYSGPSPHSQAPPASSPAQQMITSGKLLLLVRVEGTLVDVAKPVSVDKWPVEQRQQLQLSVKTQHPNDTSLMQLPGSLLWVKLRPGIRTCLMQLAACFSMRLVR